MTKTATTYDLAGKVAIVTGGFGGFGTAIGARLRASGATVLEWDLSIPPDALAGTSFAVDVTDRKSVEAAASAVRERFGRLDILVNNAGVVGTVAPIWEIEPDEFSRLLDINLTGAFLVCRALVPLMIETAASTGAGRIVNVASIQAKEGMHMAGAYSASKAGLVALTKSLGKELARKGVLANAVTPAASLTAMSIDAPKERLDDILSRIPLGRFLEPEELAAMVVWLASPECSFSTGAVFDISGGRATY